MIEGENKFFCMRLYREDCIEVGDNEFVKDLRIIGKDLSKIIIVDNSTACFSLQPNNGLEIKPFYGSRSDTALIEMGKILSSIGSLKDADLPKELSKYKKWSNE